MAALISAERLRDGGSLTAEIRWSKGPDFNVRLHIRQPAEPLQQEYEAFSVHGDFFPTDDVRHRRGRVCLAADSVELAVVLAQIDAILAGPAPGGMERDYVVLKELRREVEKWRKPRA